MKGIRLMLLCIMAVPLVFLGGCYDQREIDETAYVIAVGIDKTPQGFGYTFQLCAPGEEGGKEEGAKNTSVKNISVKAEDFYTAKNLMLNFLSKNVDMSHLKIIVFSDKIDQEGFLRHSQFILREREVRPHTVVAVARDSAEEYIKNVNPELETNTSKYYELMSMGENNVYAPAKKLSKFVDEISSEGGISILPVASQNEQSNEEGSNPIKQPWIDIQNGSLESERPVLNGMAIFKNGKVKEIENGDFALIYNILKKEIKNCTISLRNPYNESEVMTFRISVPNSAKYKVDNTKTPCDIFVSQGLKIEFFGGDLPEGFSSPKEMEAFLDSVITEKFTEYFYSLSREKKTDIMGVGETFKSQFLTESQWNYKEWQRLFEGAEFYVDVYFVW